MYVLGGTDIGAETFHPITTVEAIQTRNALPPIASFSLLSYSGPPLPPGVPSAGKPGSPGQPTDTTGR
jgi:hypothetical protein